MARTGKAETVGDILPRIIKKPKLKKGYAENLVFARWEKIVGRTIAAHVRPERMDFKTLLLSSDSPAWANELKYQERALIDKINAYVCTELVKSVGFCARSRRRRNLCEEEAPARAECPRPVESEIKCAERLSGAIGDEKIRNAAARAMALSLAKAREAGDTGQKKCPDCGRITEKGYERCEKCARKRREEKARLVRELLLQRPYMRYHEIYRVAGCPPETAFGERIKLMQEISGRIAKGDEESDDVRMLAMMRSSVRPEELTPEIIRKTLHAFRFDIRNR